MVIELNAEQIKRDITNNDAYYVSHNEEDEIQIEFEDDTPEADKEFGTPLPKEVIEELENDDLEAYSKEAKQRIMQAKKVYPDMTLWQEIVFLKQWAKGKFCVENLFRNEPFRNEFWVGGSSYGGFIEGCA